MSVRNQLQSTEALLRELGAKFTDEQRDLWRMYEIGQGTVVVGLLKRGKSTLVNALVGLNLSPIGREPETWSSIHIERGEWRAWWKDGFGQEHPLPAEPDEFRKAIGRRQGLPQDVSEVRFSGPVRLPNQFRLIDTPGANEIGEEFDQSVESLDLEWRHHGAVAGVLVTSFPPGVSREDRILFEKMQAHFGSHLLVVMKAVDSSVSDEELSAAAGVWADVGVNPVILAESRQSPIEEWGRGYLAEVEIRITEMHERAVAEFGNLEQQIRKMLCEVSDSYFRASSTETPYESVVTLRRSYGIDLIPHVKVASNARYVSVIERMTDMRRSSIEELLDAAHCGSTAAQVELKSIFAARLAAAPTIWGPQDLYAKRSECIGLIEFLNLLRMEPNFSTYEPLKHVELTIPDIEHLSDHGIFEVEGWQEALRSSTSKLADRLKTDEDFNRFMAVSVHIDSRRAALRRLLDRAENPTGGMAVGSLIFKFANLNVSRWHTMEQSLVEHLNKRLAYLHEKVRTELAEIVATDPRLHNLSNGMKSNFTNQVLAGRARNLQSTCLFGEKMAAYLTRENYERNYALQERLAGQKGVINWIDHTTHLQNVDAASKRTGITVAKVIGYVFVGLAAIVGVGNGKSVAWPLGLAAGAVAFWMLAYLRSSRYAFCKYDDFLEFKERRTKWSEEWHPRRNELVLAVICILGTWLAAVITDAALASSPGRLQTVFSNETVPTYSSLPGYANPASGSDQPSVVPTTEAGAPSEGSVSTSPPDVSTLALSDAAEICGSGYLDYSRNSGSFTLSDAEPQVNLSDQWTAKPYQAALLECGDRIVLAIVDVSQGDARLVSSDRGAATQVERLATRIVRLGTSGQNCCFPDVPFESVILWSINRDGSISTKTDDASRYPFWNPAIDDCDRLVSDQYFQPIGVDGEELDASGYATVCVKGALVKQLQESLIADGYDLVADGRFGPRTLRALKSVAIGKGVGEVDGAALVDGSLYFARTSGR